jgi:hypothetical protein
MDSTMMTVTARAEQVAVHALRSPSICAHSERAARLWNDLHAPPEWNATLDLFGGILGTRVTPCGIRIFGAVTTQRVIVGGAFPWTESGFPGGVQERLFNGIQREIVIAFDNHGVVGLRNDLIIPNGFHGKDVSFFVTAGSKIRNTD